MKTIVRRLTKLEEEFTPKRDERKPSVVDLILPARRRRMEANGERYEEPPPVSISRFDEHGNRRTLSDIILSARRELDARKASAEPE